ncbi:MAG: sugar-binding protein, partial [Bacteroidia bacterium]|nr:sugar-binding protein [Bacteroidia bacterium]
MSDQDKNTTQSAKISVQEISLPKGGGSIKGMGDSFQPNSFSGTGSYSIPIPVTQARGLEPQLSLNYNSGSGNSEFGLGFSLSLPRVRVRTDKGTPEYQGKNLFILDGAGELTQTSTTNAPNGVVIYAYAPRVEGLFSKIEQYIDKSSGNSYWKVVSKNNITSLYGSTTLSQVANPTNVNQIFQWLIAETQDAKGNKIMYEYAAENNDNVPDTIFEVNRVFTANRYLTSAKYGNYFDTAGTEQFGFELVFDYGEYDLRNLNQPGCDPYKKTKSWDCRPDPFSSYTSGFEIRTYRLCKNVLLFHYFKNELGDLHCLNKTLSLSYNNLQKYGEHTVESISLLINATINGYRKKTDGSYNKQSMPSVQLNYSAFNPPQTPLFSTLKVNNNTLPGFLDTSEFLPVDLNGDGLPGFLYANNNSTLYFEPTGNGEYAAANELNLFPIDKNISDGAASLVDIDGNGELELMVNSSERAGYYQFSNTDGWKNFMAFDSFPQGLNQSIEMTDLDGNGKTDMFLAEENDLLCFYSKGKLGYTPGARTQRALDFPLNNAGYAGSLVSFANIFGDGLSHRVKITNGSLECWPNLGYGKFGEKISFANAPRFSGTFDCARLFFADVDGSGTADVVYVYADRADIFINQNGNSFSDPVSIIFPEEFSNTDRISFADLLGNGTSCLVFSKLTTTPPNHYYYNFVGETILQNREVQKVMKPYLLNEISNNIGLVTQISYCSSTKFAVEDRLAGRPWCTKLRFPVQVVEETTTYDLVSATKFTSKYKYHDGYYDPIERQFKGFGFVESWDTETYEQFAASSTNSDFPLTRLNQELFVPPVYTKTWYYTGAYLEYESLLKQYNAEFYNGDTEAYNFPDNVFDPAIYLADEEIFRQAYVALSGNTIRTEVYADDQLPRSSNPFTVTTSNYKINLLLNPGGDNAAVFLVSPNESISYNYERNPADPQVSQQFVLDTDLLCGQPKKSCTVFLPRRSVSGPGITVYPDQLSLKATAATSAYINTDDNLAYRYRGVLCNNQDFEITGLTLAPGKMYFSFDDIKTQTDIAFLHLVPYLGNSSFNGPQIHQLSLSNIYFWNDDQTAELSCGSIGQRALLSHTEQAAFTTDNINTVFGTRITDDIITEQAGYILDPASGYWFNKGLVQYYFSDPYSFYVTSYTENSFAALTSSLRSKTTAQFDSYYLNILIIAQFINDTLTNVSTASIDYQVNKPFQLIDLNNNVSQVLFDSLGQVIVSTLFGKENAVAIGGMRLYEYEQQAAEYIERETTSTGQPITFDDVIANPEYYLQGAAS